MKRWGMKRWLALVLLPSVAAAQAPPAVWSGTYVCNQGATAVVLTVRPTGQGNDARAVFHFSADRSNPGVPEGCFAMSGAYDSRHLSLRAGEWLLQPSGYVTVDVDARISSDGRSAIGHVTGPGCSDLVLTRAKRDPGEGRCGPRPIA